ncbi:MAG: hypothetical protein ACR2GU_05400 [Rubrobacteraceae bacterium]
MRRAIFLVAATFVAVLLFASVAMAQSSTMGGSTMMSSGSSMGGSTMMSSGSSMGGSTMMSSGGKTTSGSGQTGPLKNTSGTGLPTSGGPALLLPAAALLLGAGVLTFAVLRRR